MVEPATLIRRRLAVTVAVSTGVLAAAVLGGHRGEHAVHNLLIPGLGFVEAGWWAVALGAVVVVAALVPWLRWGAEWVPVVVVLGAAIAAAATAPVAHPVEVRLAAHEFPVVAVVVAALAWIDRLRRSGGSPRRRLGTRMPRSATDLPRSERVQLALLQSFVGPVDASLVDGAAVARAHRVDLVARCRRRGDLAADHGSLRLARIAVADGTQAGGVVGTDAADRLVAEARVAPAGVPAAEPGWIRLLDATLTALALERAGDLGARQRWGHVLAGHLAPVRGHRPASWWTPLGIRIGRAPVWEDVAASALAAAAGCSAATGDWPRLRRRVLASTAHGSDSWAHERTIAAGRIWVELVDDAEARRVLARPTVGADPIAVALDEIARRLATEPDLFRPQHDLDRAATAGSATTAGRVREVRP